MTFKEFINKHKKHGLEQKQLALWLGVTEQTLVSWKRNDSVHLWFLHIMQYADLLEEMGGAGTFTRKVQAYVAELATVGLITVGEEGMKVGNNINK